MASVKQNRGKLIKHIFFYLFQFFTVSTGASILTITSGVVSSFTDGFGIAVQIGTALALTRNCQGQSTMRNSSNFIHFLTKSLALQGSDAKRGASKSVIHETNGCWPERTSG